MVAYPLKNILLFQRYLDGSAKTEPCVGGADIQIPARTGRVPLGRPESRTWAVWSRHMFDGG